jgi:hypothetical protein
MNASRLRHLVCRIHELGPRALYELFCELDDGAPLRQRLEAYARLNSYGDFIRQHGGDRLFPAARLVSGQRR